MIKGVILKQVSKIMSHNFCRDITAMIDGHRFSVHQSCYES